MIGNRLSAALSVVVGAILLLLHFPGTNVSFAAEPTRKSAVESGRVGKSVFESYSRDTKARVMIVFDIPRDSVARHAPTSDAGKEEIAWIRGQILSLVPASEIRVTRRFQTLSAFAAEISESALLALLRDSRIRRVDLDAPGEGHLAEGLPLAEVDDLKTLGYSGQGVTIGVLDSGYDSDHPDLADDLVGEQCFCTDNGAGCCPDGSTTQSGTGSAEDDHGHGTNVTGIITSKGTVAIAGGAPDADIVAVKVLDENNVFCCSSDIVAGLDWIAAERPDVDVINMSLGTFALFDDVCDDEASYTMALANVVDTLHANGVVIFASTGNQASDTGIEAPSCIDNVIAMGAVYDSNVGAQSFPGFGCMDTTTAADQVTCFSNSNAVTDLFAPGSPITSTGLGGGTSTFSGTSQASPMAAACAALMLEKAPASTPARLEERLKASPTTVTDPGNSLSFPRLDCYDAGTPCTNPETLDLSAGQVVVDTVVETACRSIEAGPYEISGSGNATFRAGESIALNNGFSIATGGTFKAQIDALLIPPP